MNDIACDYCGAGYDQPCIDRRGRPPIWGFTYDPSAKPVKPHWWARRDQPPQPQGEPVSIHPNPDIHTQMESMRTDIADLYLQLAERDTEIARMREAELHRAKSFGLALAERDAEVEDLNGRIVDLINDRDEMAKLARERLEELNELDAYLDKVCNERDEARTQVIALQTALEQVRAENEALRASFDEDDVYNEAHRLTVTADILSAFRDSIERLDDQLTKLETLEA